MNDEPPFPFFRKYLFREYIALTPHIAAPAHAINTKSGARPMTPEQTDAEGKALKLLMSYLTPHQKMTMARHGFLYERGGETWYALYDGIQLCQLGSHGEPLRMLGIYIAPPGGAYSYPRADRLLGQLLMLRANYGQLRQACRAPVNVQWLNPGVSSVWNRPPNTDVMPLLRARTYWPGPLRGARA